MAYVIFSANGVEIDRRELGRGKPYVVGRAPDCDIPVPDILLSRHHCRLEPVGGHEEDKWVVLDLGSKNGTYLGNRQVSRHVLTDGDVLRLGPRTRITFRAGAFEENPLAAQSPPQPRAARPADPTEALAGTVSGFLLVEPDEVHHRPNTPRPQPKPVVPSSYRTEDVYGMLSEIMSSSWDSIMEQASRPIVRERPLPRPKLGGTVAGAGGAGGRKQRVALSLQAPRPDDDVIRLDEDASAERVEKAELTVAGLSVTGTTAPAEGPHDQDYPPHAVLPVVPAKPAASEPVALAKVGTSAAVMAAAASATPPAPRPEPRWWQARFWDRPRRPGRFSLSREARQRAALVVLTTLATAVFAGSWVIAIWLGPAMIEASPAAVRVQPSPPEPAPVPADTHAFEVVPVDQTSFGPQLDAVQSASDIVPATPAPPPAAQVLPDLGTVRAVLPIVIVQELLL